MSQNETKNNDIISDYDKFMNTPNDDEKMTSNDNNANNNGNNIKSKTSKVETTLELAKRLKQNVYYVVHEGLDWSYTMNINPKWKYKETKKYLYTHSDGSPKMDCFVSDVFSPETCKTLLELCEERGFEDCGYPVNYRSNTRLITNDPSLANALYERIKPLMPKTYEMNDHEWEICGLNPRFRWCKYIKGQKFGVHCDSVYKKSENCMSLYTVNIYLNDPKEYPGKQFHGKTRFYQKRGGNPIFSCNAAPGRALIFNHWPEFYLHDGIDIFPFHSFCVIKIHVILGEMVESGKKYLMRTDVMYRKTSETN